MSVFVIVQAFSTNSINRHRLQPYRSSDNLQVFETYKEAEQIIKDVAAGRIILHEDLKGNHFITDEKLKWLMKKAAKCSA